MKFIQFTSSSTFFLRVQAVARCSVAADVIIMTLCHNLSPRERRCHNVIIRKKGCHNVIIVKNAGKCHNSAKIKAKCHNSLREMCVLAHLCAFFIILLGPGHIFGLGNRSYLAGRLRILEKKISKNFWKIFDEKWQLFVSRSVPAGNNRFMPRKVQRFFGDGKPASHQVSV